jgi:peptide/nickel transport system ATP-binding protein
VVTASPNTPPAGNLLSVRNLVVEYQAAGGVKPIVTGIDLDVNNAETVGIVGESGSGKSLSARAIMRLLPSGVRSSGSAMFRSRDIFSLSSRQMTQLRGSQVSMLFQDPFTMLNPVFRAGRHIEEVLRSRSRDRPSRSAARLEAQRRLAEVGITDPDAGLRYPFQLSGGMRQRVALAAALAGDPELLIADEPTTALDVTTEAEILKLLKQVQVQRGMGLVLITHDLRIAFSVCERIYVLYAGSLVEMAPSSRLQEEPLHPYSLGLMLSEPAADRRQATLTNIQGSVPSPSEVSGMCAFAPRCRWANEACRSAKPALTQLRPGRYSACIRVDQIGAEMAGMRVSLLQGAPAVAPSTTVDPLLKIDDVYKVFNDKTRRAVKALSGVTIEVGHNESVGLVGESGSGKSTLGRCIVGLETASSGRIVLDGRDISDLNRLKGEDREAVRELVQIVFQDPYSSLDPMQTVGSSLREILSIHKYPHRQVNQRINELLELVRLPVNYARRKPSALSGGERQRVAIARALAVNPRLLVCDEPVSALDVSVQAQVLSLFRSLREELKLSYLFITHDLAVVRQIVDRVYVLYRGEIVEHGPVDQILDMPTHDYTTKLIASVPKSASRLSDEDVLSRSSTELVNTPLADGTGLNSES